MEISARTEHEISAKGLDDSATVVAPCKNEFGCGVNFSILKLMVPNIEKHAGKMISLCVVLVGNRYKFAIVIRWYGNAT